MSFLKKNKLYVIVVSSLVILGIICYILNQASKDKNITYVESGENISFLKKYEVNQFVPVYMTDEQMTTIYYNDYIQKMLYNREEAYNLLDKSFKKRYYPTFSDYNEYVESLLNKSPEFYLNTVTLDKNKKKTYYALDSNNYLYTFNVTAVMVYTVRFDVKQ